MKYKKILFVVNGLLYVCVCNTATRASSAFCCTISSILFNLTADTKMLAKVHLNPQLDLSV
jgi:hypothetical protein